MNKELQVLVGARFQKAYGLPKEVYMQLHKSGHGKELLRIRAPEVVHLSEHKPVFPQNPPGFVMSLRKHLGGSRLRAIRQAGLDRILIFEFVRGRDDEFVYELIIELMIPGNIVLANGLDKKIISVFSHNKGADRTIRPGAIYEFPAKKIDLTHSDEQLIAQALEFDSLSKALAVGFSLGGYYANLVCERAKLDSQKEPIRSDLESALSVARQLLEESPLPGIVNNKVVAFSEKKDFDSLSKAIDSLVVLEDAPSFTKAKKKPKKTIKEMQLLQKKGFETASDDNQKKGELVYTHYLEIQEALDAIKKGEQPKSQYFKKFDKKTGILTFDFPE